MEVGAPPPSTPRPSPPAPSRPSPPPTPPSPPPEGRAKLNILTNTADDQDRGVDLSFDMVKKESFEAEEAGVGVGEGELRVGVGEVGVGELRVKSEFSSEAPTQSPGSKLGGGRLKFYKEKRLILELCHRVEGDKVSWVPTTKKVYWPPAASGHTARLDSTTSSHTGPGSEETSSSHSQPSLSPWHPSSPRPSPSLPPASPHPSPSWQPAPPHRLKAVPRKWAPSTANHHLVFGMKPPQGVRNYRKKLKKSYKRKTRNPCKEMKIGLFILKLECNANPPWRRTPQRRRENMERVVRLETQVARIVAMKSRVQVPITAWRTGRQDLYGLVKGPPTPGSPMGVRVKSELKLVTETCTAALTSVTSAPRFSGKVKAETRTVTAETKSVPVRTMPITPTVARVKQETPLDRLKSATVTSLMSPELQRVRMEIGPGTPLLGSTREDRDSTFISPRKRYMRDFDNGSPSAKNRRVSVEHRLSTDSLGSTSDRSSPYRAPHSPHRAPHSPHRAPTSPGGASPRPGGKVSNFSIDSIMGGGGLAKAQVTPSRSSTLRSPSHQMLVAPTPTRPSPTPTKTPPPASPFASLLGGYPSLNPLQQVQMQMFQQQMLQQAALLQGQGQGLDPRLAQLASLQQAQALQALQGQGQGLDPRLAQLADPRVQQALAQAQDPRLTPGSAYPFAPSLFPPMAAFSPFTSAASSAASPAPGGVWTPPVVTTATPSTPSTPPPATIAPPRQFASSPQHPPTPTSSTRPAPEAPGRPGERPPSSMARPPPSATSMELAARLASPTPLGRGSSPAPSAHKPAEAHPRPLDFLLQRAGAQQPTKQRSHDNEDAPLNLSMKPTSL